MYAMTVVLCTMTMLIYTTTTIPFTMIRVTRTKSYKQTDTSEFPFLDPSLSL